MARGVHRRNDHRAQQWGVYALLALHVPASAIATPEAQKTWISPPEGCNAPLYPGAPAPDGGLFAFLGPCDDGQHFVVRFDHDGQAVWFTEITAYRDRDEPSETFHAVDLMASDKTGKMVFLATEDPLEEGVALYAITADGALEWTATYAPSPPASHVVLMNLEVDDDGEPVVILCPYDGACQGIDVVRYWPTGLKRSEHILGPSYSADISKAVPAVVGKNGWLYMAARESVSDRDWIRAVTPDGELRWETSSAGAVNALAIGQGEQLVAVGYDMQECSPAGAEAVVWLIEAYDASSGGRLWERRWDQDEACASVMGPAEVAGIDRQGNIYVAGMGSERRSVLVSLDDAGGLRWHHQWPDMGFWLQFPTWLHVSNDGQVYVAGIFRDAFDGDNDYHRFVAAHASLSADPSPDFFAPHLM